MLSGLPYVYSLLTNAEALSPQVTICFACSNQIFRSPQHPTIPFRSTTDVVSNMEKSQSFYALYNVSHL